MGKDELDAFESPENDLLDLFSEYDGRTSPVVVLLFEDDMTESRCVSSLFTFNTLFSFFVLVFESPLLFKRNSLSLIKVADALHLHSALSLLHLLQV